MTNLLKEIEKEELRDDLPEFCIGDTIKITLKIIEGEKQRSQIFTGLVVNKKSSGSGSSFIVHRVAYGYAMQKVFPLHSPKIISIEVIKKGKVRRARLNYLCGKTGKAAKVQEKKVYYTSKKKVVETAVEEKPATNENQES
jgi:large subunit ribosomal protein L19